MTSPDKRLLSVVPPSARISSSMPLTVLQIWIDFLQTFTLKTNLGGLFARWFSDAPFISCCEEDAATREQLAAAGDVQVSHSDSDEMLSAVDCDVVGQTVEVIFGVAGVAAQLLLETDGRVIEQAFAGAECRGDDLEDVDIQKSCGERGPVKVFACATG